MLASHRRRTSGLLLRFALFAAILWAPMVAAALDVDPWNRVLKAHAKRGGFDYEGLKNDPEALQSLDRFLSSVATMNENESLSSWLNAYNALVVKGVIDRYPVRSVKDIKGFFDRIRHRVAGQPRTLDDIENRLIRPRFNDARVHVALNCGAVSCPPLHPRAFRQASLGRTLDRLARAWVRSEHHVRVDGSALLVSELFFWFEEDFRRDAGSVRAWLDRYDATDRLARVPKDAELGKLPYRWRLNDR